MKKTECVIFGGLLLDKYYQIRQLPQRGQDGFIDGEFDWVGGCAVNMAATFHNLGGQAHVVSYIGRDQAGDRILEYMKEHDFSLRYVKQKNGDTGYCMVFLEPDGERTFLTRTGMELEFSGDILSDRMKGIRYAAVTGYFLLNDGREKILEVLEEFSHRGGYILFDPSPLVGDIQQDILKRMLKISNILTPNTSEISALVQCGQSVACGQIEELTQRWISQFVSAGKHIILKQGAMGGTLYKANGCSGYTALRAEAVDTTGAGDSFAAGVLFGVASGLSVENAIQVGVHTAAVTVGINGPHGFWQPDESMKNILDRNTELRR